MQSKNDPLKISLGCLSFILLSLSFLIWWFLMGGLLTIVALEFVFSSAYRHDVLNDITECNNTASHWGGLYYMTCWAFGLVFIGLWPRLSSVLLVGVNIFTVIWIYQNTGIDYICDSGEKLQIIRTVGPLEKEIIQALNCAIALAAPVASYTIYSWIITLQKRRRS